ncbi:MAG TPA: hypothetical protein VHV83_02335, partial [Armatimonadota bacterium]|nr:hypothetical protein [Armatimonadota bacterium]
MAPEAIDRYQCVPLTGSTWQEARRGQVQVRIILRKANLSFPQHLNFAGQMPASIREFEELADHYGIPSVWMGLHAFNDVKAGRMRWEEWLPDGLHPQDRGSYSYAQSV